MLLDHRFALFTKCDPALYLWATLSRIYHLGLEYYLIS